MAGVPAGLPAGVRVSDHISLGVIAKTFLPERVQQVLAETGKASERDLPACAWRINSFSGMRCGDPELPPAPTCCGG